MKRYNVIKLFSSYLKDDDLAIFAGNSICKEAYLHDRPGNFYVEDEIGIGLSLALGIVMCTDKRVFVFCDDYYFIKELGASIHFALSKCRNLFLVVLVSGEYQYSGRNPTIFNEIVAYKTMMFGAGFITNDYTKHFSTVANSKWVKELLGNLYGPIFISVHVDLGENKKAGEINLTTKEKLERLTTFLLVKGTSIYKDSGIDFSFKVEGV